MAVEPLRTEHGEVPAESIADELQHLGFDVVSWDDRFIDDPVHGAWWLIIAIRR